MIARCILFLKSEETYSYPEENPSYSNSALIPNWTFKAINYFTFGKYDAHITKKNKEFYNAGDTSVWPFKSRRHLKAIERQIQKNQKGLMPKGL